MTRGELNELFNEFVLNNAPRASSLIAIKAVSRLADLKMRLDKIPYAGVEQAGKMILEEQDSLVAILPKKRNVPGVDFAFKTQELILNRLISACNETT
jgi:hypothetical protein